VDFSTVNGGGSQTSPDSFLGFQYTALKSTNGYLYCIGDSSVSYISNPQTSGTPATTTFTYLNADSAVGASTWNDAVISMGRELLVANPTGIYQLRGGALQKISHELDGFYYSVINGSGSFITPSMAQMVLFGRRVWMTLAAVVNPVTNVIQNKFMIFDGKRWFTSQQGPNIIYITTGEFASQFTMYGTDGTNLYKLFLTPSSNFQKTIQSKFWTQPDGYHAGKAGTRLWSLLTFNFLDQGVNVTIENENPAQTSVIALPIGSYVGTMASPPEAIGQQGVLSGMTLNTFAADMEINSVMIGSSLVQYRG
jgi:hypothetical protein